MLDLKSLKSLINCKTYEWLKSGEEKDNHIPELFSIAKLHTVPYMSRYIVGNENCI